MLELLKELDNNTEIYTDVCDFPSYFQVRAIKDGMGLGMIHFDIRSLKNILKNYVMLCSQKLGM